MNLRDKKGAISIFVLVGLLFMSAFLIISFASNVNKSKTVKEQFNIISGIYTYHNEGSGAYTKSYEGLRYKNKETKLEIRPNGSNTNTSIVEFTKTFDESFSEFKIYGDSVRDEQTGEIKHVGDETTNLLLTTIESTDELTGEKNITKRYYDENYVERNGVTFTVNDDGSITAVGEATGNAANFYLYRNRDKYSDGSTVIHKTFEPGTYIMSGGIGAMYYADSYEGKIVEESIVHVVSDKPFILPRFTIEYANGDKEEEDMEFVYIYISIPVGTTVNKTYYPQIEKLSEATEYELPDKYKVPIKITGKNLVDYKKAYVTGSRTIKIIDEGVKFSGANYFMIPCNLKAGTTVTLSYDSNINIANQMCVKYVGANSFKYCSGHKVTLTNDITDIGIYKGNPSVSEENVIFKNIQLEIGTEVTQYHQYVEPIKKKVFLEEPLRKVGDTADYIDLRNKLLVRKIGVIESYNGETITTEYLSSTGSLTTGATVYYILDNEIVETIDVPDMKTFEDYTKIEILTELPPSRVNLRYEGYTLD